MSQRRRLDAELVRRGMARSREHAASLIADGRVRVRGLTATKPATSVGTAEPVHVSEKPEGEEYVSRGGHKLAGALDAFEPGGLTVAGRRCLDAGASTGGFTDVLLRRAAAQVVAVDVGYGQLAWSLRSDDRVTVLDRTNIRDLSLADIGDEPVDVVVADLSFISLRLVLRPLRDVTLSPTPATHATSPTPATHTISPTPATAPADLVLMVKPQFEVGRDFVGKGGVVRDPQLRAGAVREVAAAGEELGLGVLGVVASPLPGPSGNVEYFVWMRLGAPPLDPAALDRAISEGPQ